MNYNKGMDLNWNKSGSSTLIVSNLVSSLIQLYESSNVMFSCWKCSTNFLRIFIN